MIEAGYVIPFPKWMDMSWFHHDRTIWNYERLDTVIARANKLNSSKYSRDWETANEIHEGNHVYETRPVAFGIARGYTTMINLEATTAALPRSFLKREVDEVYVHVEKPIPDIINFGIGHQEPAHHVH